MPWIMEVYVYCLRCRGNGKVGNPMEDGPHPTCEHCGGVGSVWHPVRSHREKRVYSYDTQAEAASMLRICYPEAMRDWRLGADKTARIREVEVVPEPESAGPRQEG